MQYRLRVIQRVYEDTWLTIEADSEEQAEQKAMHDINTGDIEVSWHFLECDQDFPLDVVHTEQIVD